MSVETVFLEVLVVALLIGNVLLSLIPANGHAKRNVAGSGLALMGGPPEMNVPAGVLGNSNGVAFAESASVILSNIKALNNKINLLAGQVESVDSKVKKFDNFRANTGVELQALKEILLELQNRYITAKAKTIVPEKGMSGTEMHKIIYRSK